MSFNPLLTTAQNLAFVMQRNTEQRAGQESTLETYRVISTPNGQSYGDKGHIPCDHKVVFWYVDSTGAFKKEFSKAGNWTERTLVHRMHSQHALLALRAEPIGNGMFGDML